MNNQQLAKIVALIDDEGVIAGLLDMVKPDTAPPPVPTPNRIGRKWTETERDELRNMAKVGSSIESMCVKLNRSPEGIAAQLRKLGYKFDRDEVNRLRRPR